MSFKKNFKEEIIFELEVKKWLRISRQNSRKTYFKWSQEYGWWNGSLKKHMFSPVLNPQKEGEHRQGFHCGKTRRRIEDLIVLEKSRERVDAGIVEGVALKAISRNIELRSSRVRLELEEIELVIILNMCEIRTLMESGPRIEKRTRRNWG